MAALGGGEPIEKVVSKPTASSRGLALIPKTPSSFNTVVWQGFVRECYHNKVLEPMKIMDEDEMADVLSKALPTGKEKNIIFRKTCMNMQE